jgi:hypothetical protein
LSLTIILIIVGIALINMLREIKENLNAKKIIEILAYLILLCKLLNNIKQINKIKLIKEHYKLI